MRYSFFGVIILTTVQLTSLGCGGSQKHTAPSRFLGQNDSRLGADDTFEVRVYDEKELSGKFRVAPDGSIDYPFIGRIQVGGLEPPQVADLIAKKLKDGGYLREPQVSVLIEQYNSKRITVLGAVVKPGAFSMTNDLTLVQLISLAGGFTALASENDTLITRRVNGKLTRYRVKARDIIEGRLDDFEIQGGDSIFVPERIF